MPRCSSSLIIGLSLLLVCSIVVSGAPNAINERPFTVDDSGDNSGSGNTTSQSETDFKDPSKIAEENPSDYRDPGDVVDNPLFTPSQRNTSSGTSSDHGRWSNNTEIKDDCTGDWWNPGDYACQARDGFFEAIYGAIIDALQWTMEGTYAFLFATPAPKDANGNPAILEQANNWPWKTIYADWFPYARMAGGALWAFMMLCLLVTDTFLPMSVERNFELRQLRQRMLIAFPLIVIAPTVASLFLNFVDALLHLVRPSGGLAGETLQRFFSQMGSVGLAIVLSWLFESILFIVMIVILLIRWALLLVFGAFLPILLPLAIIDVGPVKYITEPIRGLFSMFATFALIPVPMGMSVTVGMLVVNAYEQSVVNQTMWQTVLVPFTGPSASMGAIAIPAFILFAFWTLAAIMPFLVFYWKGRAIHGFVSGVLGGTEIPDLESTTGDKDVDHGVGRYRSDDILEGSPYQYEANFDSRFGGALESPWIARPSGPDYPPLDPPKQGNQPAVFDQVKPATTTNPQNMPESYVDSQIPIGYAGFDTDEMVVTDINPDETTSASNGSKNNSTQNSRSSSNSYTGSSKRTIRTPKVREAARRGKSVTEVIRYTDLPDKKYSAGVLHDDGKFTPFETEEGHLTKQSLVGNNHYNRYRGVEQDSDELVVIKDPDTDRYYSLDRITSRGSANGSSARRTQEQFNDLDERDRRRRR